MNIYAAITERILKQLDAGVIPWRKTWNIGLPKSLSTGKEYRGLNVLVLSSTAFSSRYWLTYKEAIRLGGHVRKGERATPVIYWKWRNPEEFEKRRQQTGKENPAPCVPFAFAVFNLDQIEGVERPVEDISANHDRRLELADQLMGLVVDKPTITHELRGNPAYNPRTDAITLPHLSQFENAEEYYAALFHELTHSTGHPKRLNRFATTEGHSNERYSQEELVAEFGAAFLCGFTCISNTQTEALQASYIDGWKRALRADQRLLLRAASAAQVAADYLRGKIWSGETERPA